MDAGRLQGLTTSLGCSSSCLHLFSHGKCHLSTVLSGFQKMNHSHDYANAHCQVLRIKSRKGRRQGSIRFTEAALVHDITAAAVAVATVFPVCWFYMNRMNSSSSSSSLSSSRSTPASSKLDSRPLNAAYNAVDLSFSAGEQTRTLNVQCQAKITTTAESPQSTQVTEIGEEISLISRASNGGIAVGQSSTHSAPSLPSINMDENVLTKGSDVSNDSELADFIVDIVHNSRAMNQDPIPPKTDGSPPKSFYLTSADTTSEIMDSIRSSGFRTDSSAETVAQGINGEHSAWKQTVSPIIADIRNLQADCLSLEQRDEVENTIISDKISTFSKENVSKKCVQTGNTLVSTNDMLEQSDRNLEFLGVRKDCIDRTTARDGKGMLAPEYHPKPSEEFVGNLMAMETDRCVPASTVTPPFCSIKLSSGTAVLSTNSRKQISTREGLEFSAGFASQVYGQHDVEAFLSAYNLLIRSNRLTEALELLEEAGRKGILNMDKIYHTRFYQVCRDKQAVKEAFRFTKLVKNPTLSTFNMLLSVCASAADVQGAFRVMNGVKKAGFQADCILYTSLISACAKAGKVDLVFKVFYEMEGVGVPANAHTYAAMIDSCARTGQVAKAFGFYQIMTSRNIKADRVVYNSLINACGRSGVLERAFSVFSKMKAENIPVEPDHVTVGSLIDACGRAGEVELAIDVYNTMKGMGTKLSTEVYTAAIHACSGKKDFDLALQIYADMRKDGVQPDEVLFSALIDVAGSIGQVETAFDILKEMHSISLEPGVIVYSCLMGVCSKKGKWEMALELYEEMKASSLDPSTSTFNALLTALCDAKHVTRALDIFQEMRQTDSAPNEITYTILLTACVKEDVADAALQLYLRAASKGVAPNVKICDSVIGLCLKKIRNDAPPPPFTCPLGPLHTVTGKEEPRKQWASWALAVYRQTISAGIVPPVKLFSRLLGCLRIPETVPPEGLTENGALWSASSLHGPRKHSMMEGFGIYDPRALTLYEEASALGVVPHFSSTNGPIVFDAKTMPSFVTEVCVLTILKGLKHRHAVGARLPSLIIQVDVDGITLAPMCGDTKLIPTGSRTGQAIQALLKRLRLQHNGYPSSGMLRINGKTIENWLRPSKEEIKKPFVGVQNSLALSSVLGKSILEQQRAIRMAEISRSALDVRPVLSQNGALKKSEVKDENCYPRREATPAAIPQITTTDEAL